MITNAWVFSRLPTGRVLTLFFSLFFCVRLTPGIRFVAAKEDRERTGPWHPQPAATRRKLPLPRVPQSLSSLVRLPDTVVFLAAIYLKIVKRLPVGALYLPFPISFSLASPSGPFLLGTASVAPTVQSPMTIPFDLPRPYEFSLFFFPPAFKIPDYK